MLSQTERNCQFVALPKIYKYLNGNEWKVFTVLFDEWQMMKKDDGFYYRSWKELCADANIASATLDRCLKSLKDKKFIIIRKYGNGEQRANDYSINVEFISTLIPTSKNEVAYFKNESTTKEEKTKKELYVNKPVEVQSEEHTEIESTSTHNEIKVLGGEEMKNYTHQEVRELNEIYSKEWKELEETRQSERNTSKYNEINEWVGKKLSRGYDLLKSFRSAKTLQGAKGYEEELFNIIEKMKKADVANAITEKQSSAFEKFINAYNDAVQNKIEYFNRSKEKAGETKQSQMVRNGENAQDHNLSNEDMEKAFNSEVSEQIEKAAPTPATPSRDELVKQGKRVTWDIQEMAEKAQELASSELSDETINEKVDEWVFYHTAAVPTTVIEIYKSMMKNKISGLRATGTQNTDAA